MTNSVKTIMARKRAAGTKKVVAAESDVDEFLKRFIATVGVKGSVFEPNSVDKKKGDGSENVTEEENDFEELASLVWSNNWKAELERRRQTRVDAAKERAIQAEKDAAEYAMHLKEALASSANNESNNEVATEEATRLKCNENNQLKPGDVVQVSSAVRNLLIGEGHERNDVLNALLDSNGDETVARSLLQKQQP